MSKEIMQQALTVLKDWDGLIKYQYTGSSEAMTDMQHAAWNTMDAISALETELAKPEQEWVGLTEVDCDKAWEHAQKSSRYGVTRIGVFAKTIEAKLRSKNGDSTR
jgi:hypothetical protein